MVDTKGVGITQITPAGPIFEDKAYELDVLIYATGFEVQKTGIYNEIRGKNGFPRREPGRRYDVARYSRARLHDPYGWPHRAD